MEGTVGKIQELMEENLRLKAQVELLKSMVGHAPMAVVASDSVVERQIYHLTLKQHATLQMLLNGKSNQEIAARLGIELPTAKIHVRTVCKKFGAKNRADLVLKLSPIWAVISAENYRKVTGLPKDWDTNFKGSDAFLKQIRGAFKT
jgi:DNA-binding CsgD family transcriptional regulator